MGTQYRVKLFTDFNPVAAVKLKDQAALQAVSASTLGRVNQLMSTYLQDSEVSQINRIDLSKCQPVSPETLSVLQMADQVSQLSRGKFDVTVSPLVEIWGFGVQDVSSPPTQEAVKVALESIGYEAIRIKTLDGKPCVEKTAPRQIDLSAIAKGYAVDLLRDTLIKAGAKQFLIELGGEVWAQGEKNSGQAWKVAIETPNAMQRQVAFILNVKDAGIATSGDYRNYYEYQGKKYAHTLDPTTGYPVDNGIASVTLIMSSTGMADAWATALLASSYESAQHLVEDQKIQALFILRMPDESFKMKPSSAFCEQQDCSLINL